MSDYLPTVVIAGAPKCGSTSLFTYLADHPEICAASEQETRFLMDPDYSLARADCNVHDLGLDAYQTFFSDLDHKTHQHKLECTPDYLYQKTALDVLTSLPTPPQVFFVLRRPSKRIYSLFRFAQNNIGIIPKEETFAGFIEKVDAGEIKDDYILAHAIDQSTYIKYLYPWWERLGAERCQILLFEELISQPRDCLTRISAQLGIRTAFYDAYDFKKENQTLNVKNQSVFKLLKAARNQGTILDRLPAVKNFLRPIVHFFAIDRRKVAVTSEDEQVMQELDLRFTEKNQELTHLTGVDLRSWQGS